MPLTPKDIRNIYHLRGLGFNNKEISRKIDIPELEIIHHLEKTREDPKIIDKSIIEDNGKRKNELGSPHSKPLFFVYPHNADTYTFPSGTSVVDFYTGNVDFADGTEDTLYSSLESQGQDYISTLYIKTDKQIKISLDSEGISQKVPEKKYWYESGLKLQRLYIETTEDTEIYIYASTLYFVVDEFDTPESTFLTPQIKLGYNASGDLIKIRKVINNKTYERTITDPDISDNVVDRWVTYGEYSEI